MWNKLQEENKILLVLYSDLFFKKHFILYPMRHHEKKSLKVQN